MAATPSPSEDTDRRLTREDAEEILLFLVDSGIVPPPSLDAPAPRDAQGRPTGPSGMERGVGNLRLGYTAAGLTWRTAWEGVLAYAAEPQTSQYPRAWPTAGHVAARTNAARAVAAFPDDAAEVYYRLFIIRAGNTTEPERFVVDRSPAGDVRERAIRAGIQVLGGWAAIGSISAESRPFREKDFRAAYLLALRANPHTIPQLAPPRPQLRLADIRRTDK